MRQKIHVGSLRKPCSLLGTRAHCPHFSTRCGRDARAPRGFRRLPVVIWSALLISVGALVCGVFAPPYVSGAETRGNVMTVTVSGDGIVEVIPDLAYLTFGVTTRKITAEEAQTVNAMTMSDVISAVKDAGIDAKDISTSRFSIASYTEYDEGKREDGYQVDNYLSVTLRDIQNVSNVLTVAIKAGANRIQSVSFGIDNQNRDNAYAKALEIAVGRARTRAEAIAKAAGYTIGDVVQITEGGFYDSSPRSINIAVETFTATGVGASIATGAQTVSARITVIYVLVKL